MGGKNIYRTIINLLSFTVLVVTSLKNDVDILCGEGDTCVKNYTLHRYAREIRYDGSNILNGTLHHGIQFESSGKCFTPKFVFRGVSDLLWATWEMPALDTLTPVNTGTSGEERKEFFKKKGPPTFLRKNPPPLNLCQTIVASREIVYKPCGGTEACGKDPSGIYNGKCRKFYTATQINPVFTWLDQKAEDGNYPTVEIANKTHISINWGKAEEFKCGEDIKNGIKVGGDFTIVLEDSHKKAKSLTITHDRFKFEKDYIEIERLTTLDDPRCFTFSAKITLNLRFPELESGANHYGKILQTKEVVKTPQTFSTRIQRSLSSNGPNGKNDLADNSEIKTINKTQTYLFIQHEDKDAPINCLQKKIIVENMNNNEKHDVDINEERKVNLTSFIVVPCEETILKITSKNVANEDVIEKYYRFLPTVNASNTNGIGHLIVNEPKFESCTNLKFEVVCETLDEASDENITNTQILGYNKITKKSDEFKMEDRCKARAFLCEGTNETCSKQKIGSEWTYLYDQPGVKAGSNTVAGSVTGFIIGVWFSWLLSSCS